MAKKNLLLVDSDSKTLRMLEVSLRKAGFSVTTAISAADAREKIEFSPPDLVITETRLPDESGLKLVEELKNRPDIAMTPMIFLSSENSLDQKVRGLELGVEDYLTKPIYLKEVLTRVRILLEKLEKETVEQRERSSSFSGLLGEMGLVDLVQTIEIGRKTGKIHLDTGKSKGMIAFRGGKVVDARTHRLRGERAFYRMLVWNQGLFNMEFGNHDEPDVIELSTQGLLMEGMRRVDEWGRLLEQLPPLDRIFEIDYGELVDRLAEIPDEINGILRLFDGKRSLIDVVDDSDFGDLEALEIASKLYFEGLIYDVATREEEDAASVTVPAPEEHQERRIEEWLDHGPAEPLALPVDSGPPSPAPAGGPFDVTANPGFELAPPSELDPALAEPPPPFDDDDELGELPVPPPAHDLPPELASDDDDDWEDVVAPEVGTEETPAPSARVAVARAAAEPSPPAARDDEEDAEDLAAELGLSPDELALALEGTVQEAAAAVTEVTEAAEDDAVPAPSLSLDEELGQALKKELGPEPPRSAREDSAKNAPPATPVPAVELMKTTDVDVASIVRDTIPEQANRHDDELGVDEAFDEEAELEVPTEPGRPAARASQAEASSDAGDDEEGVLIDDGDDTSAESAYPEGQGTSSTVSTGLSHHEEAFLQGSMEPHDDHDPFPALTEEPASAGPSAGVVLFLVLLCLVGGFAGASFIKKGDPDIEPIEPVALATVDAGAAADGGARLAALDPDPAKGPDGMPPGDGPSEPGKAPGGDTGARATGDTAAPGTDASPGKAPDKTPEKTPDKTPGKTPDKAPDKTPERTAKRPDDNKPPAADRDPPPRTARAPKDPEQKREDDFAEQLRQANALTAKGKHSQSIRLYKAALALKGDSAAAHLGLGNAYYELNSIDAALVHLEQAKKLAPRDPQVYVLLGAVYQSAGKTSAAISAYERYLELAPSGRFARELRNVVEALKAEK